MAYKGDCDYTGIIAQAECVESRNGTSGFQLRLNGEAGTISHTIWITEKSLEMAKRQMRACGLTEEDMGSARIWNDPASVFCGREVQFRTKVEVDQRDGREWVKVAWIGGPPAAKAATQETKTRGINLLMSHPPAEPAKTTAPAQTWPDDDDVPF